MYKGMQQKERTIREGAQYLLCSGLGYRAKQETQLLFLQSFRSSEPPLGDVNRTWWSGDQGGTSWKVPFIPEF